MKPNCLIAFIFCAFLSIPAFGQSDALDKGLADLTEKLAARVKENGQKKVAVLDLTDLQGNASEFGRYVAEQLTIDLVSEKRDFAVLDRANLKSILAEHKLTATGLVNPDNAKKLGQFAGVDALVLGSVVPMGQNIELTAKIITTETAEVVGAGRCRFKSDEFIQQLLARTNSTEAVPAAGSEQPKREEKPIIQNFGDLRVEISPLRIINGNQYQLRMVFVNQNQRKSIWVALKPVQDDTLSASVIDANGNEFEGNRNQVSDIRVDVGGTFIRDDFYPSTEIAPTESISPVLKFSPPNGRVTATPGKCRLQLTFYLGDQFRGNSAYGKSHNIITDITAN